MKTTAGFTLIEVILTTGITLLLFSISTILLSNLIPRAHVTSFKETLRADLKLQQSRAMSGSNADAGAGAFFGIRIENQNYILFQGNSFAANDPNNVTVPLSGQSLSSNFQNQVIIFQPGSGEVLNYNQNANTITITSDSGNEIETLTLNRYGVIN